MIKKIAVDDLEIGMFVEDIGLSWIEAPFLYSRRGLIRGSTEIQAIRKEGYKEVFIDTALGTFRDTSGSEESFVEIIQKTSPPPKSRPKPLVPLRQEMPAAKRIYSDTVDFARKFITEIRKDRMPSLSESEEFIGTILGSVIRNECALLNLFKLRSYDEYTYTHSVNVAILVLIFGRYMGLPPTELRRLGIAGLFHDIGKERMPKHILKKPSRLTNEEFGIVKRHPGDSCAILRDQKGFSEDILRPILEHHEKFNGTGYPHGLAGEAIGQASAITSLADIYDALTSDRVYRKSLVQQRALQIIYAMRDEEIRTDYVEHFIKCLGVYPAGSFVRLSNGMFGVITEVNPDSLLLPKVNIILDAQRHPVPPQLLDLTLAREMGQTEVSIEACLDSRQHGVDLKKIS
jgi:HD-GYP domain-containing protein (c-di-GMP phosphodiesterase class II)